jgi:hypothetical protein
MLGIPRKWTLPVNCEMGNGTFGCCNQVLILLGIFIRLATISGVLWMHTAFGSEASRVSFIVASDILLYTDRRWLISWFEESPSPLQLLVQAQNFAFWSSAKRFVAACQWLCSRSKGADAMKLVLGPRSVVLFWPPSPGSSQFYRQVSWTCCRSTGTVLCAACHTEQHCFRSGVSLL